MTIESSLLTTLVHCAGPPPPARAPRQVFYYRGADDMNVEVEMQGVEPDAAPALLQALRAALPDDDDDASSRMLAGERSEAYVIARLEGADFEVIDKSKGGTADTAGSDLIVRHANLFGNMYFRVRTICASFAPGCA